jgi:hypothetical protein
MNFFLRQKVFKNFQTDLNRFLAMLINVQSFILLLSHKSDFLAGY